MMGFKVDPLPYSSVEPHIDARTLEFHHGKHHHAYCSKLNAAVEGTDLEVLSIEEIMRRQKDMPAAVHNNGGGFYNHNFYWSVLSPQGGGEPKGPLADEIKKVFGSFEGFKSRFADAAANQFGSGWGWLVLDDGRLDVISTGNQICPLAEGKVPLLTVDVWEHAYYLMFQNRRPDFINTFWDVVNWDRVAEYYAEAKRG
jgi:superoxide dismutase, Fe-Mn family